MMPKALIVSDSHGMMLELLAIRTRHMDEVDLMIHCGDSELDYNHETIQGFKRVGGNTDFDPEFPNELVFDQNGTTFFVAHGHMHNINLSLEPITYRASELGAKIICHGHSHRAGATQMGSQLVINPGSIQSPRDRREETYAILEWDDQGKYDVHFYRLIGEEVQELAFSTILA
mgnify:CR=1 FL=1